MTKRMAATVVILGLVGTGVAHAVDVAVQPFPDRVVPAEIARKRVIGQRPFVVGELKPASDLEVDSLMARASGDRRMFAKCVETWEGVVQWAEGRTTLGLAPPWDLAAETTVATAYCDDGVVLLGGSRREMEGGEPRTWLFYWIRTPGQEFGPVSIMTRKSYAYTLTELKAIDPVSRQLLFSGRSADGRDLLLAARFAILPRR